jgi:DNA-binding CsgD family transcriptional regulator
VKYLDETYSIAHADEKTIPAILGFSLSFAYFLYHLFGFTLITSSGSTEVISIQILYRIIGLISASLFSIAISYRKSIVIRKALIKLVSIVSKEYCEFLIVALLAILIVPISILPLVVDPASSVINWIAIIAWLSFGISAPIFFTLWASLFSALNSTKSLTYLPLIYSLSAVLIIATQFTQSTGEVALSLLFPYLSILVYLYITKYIFKSFDLAKHLAWQTSGVKHVESLSTWLETKFRRSLIVVLYSCILSFIISFAAYNAGSPSPPLGYWLYGMFIIGPLAISITLNFRGKNRYLPFSFAQRMFLPILSAGLFGIMLFSGIAEVFSLFISIAAIASLDIVCIGVNIFVTKKYNLPPLYFHLERRFPFYLGSCTGFFLFLTYLKCAEIGLQDIVSLLFALFILLIIIIACSVTFLEDMFTVIYESLDVSKGSWRKRCEYIEQSYGLSPREAEVLIHLSHGRNAAYIEKKLCISQHTARSHTAHIYSKLNISSQQELMDLIENSDVPEESASSKARNTV